MMASAYDKGREDGKRETEAWWADTDVANALAVVRGRTVYDLPEPDLSADGQDAIFGMLNPDGSWTDSEADRALDDYCAGFRAGRDEHLAAVANGMS